MLLNHVVKLIMLSPVPYEDPVDDPGGDNDTSNGGAVDNDPGIASPCAAVKSIEGGAHCAASP